MTDERSSFRERLLAVEPLSLDSRDKIQKELHAMFIQELSPLRRAFLGAVALASLASALLCGYLAVTEATLPALARAGLGTGVLFGLAWTAMAGRTFWRGSMDLRRDNRRIAAMVWVFTVLMMVFFLMTGMSAKDRLLGLMMIANGMVFLIFAAVYFLSYRIEQAEMDIRERVLQLELRLAEFCEKR